MANQPIPARPWFRLGSMVRQPAPQVPAAEPAPPQLRPSIARPTFRPVAQPQPTQTDTTPPPPVAAQRPPAPRAPASPAVPSVPTPSVPTSPGPRASISSSSLPTSPTPTTSTVVLPVTTTSSVPSSPKPRVSSPTSSLPSSPASKPAATSSSVPSSPSTRAAPKPVDSKPSSPTPKTTTPTTGTAHVPSPAQPSPRTLKPAIETPPQSPKPKPTAPPPSPLTLPPSQIKSNAKPESKIPPEAEQKDVLIQKTIEKPHGETRKPGIARTGKQGEAKETDTKEKARWKKISSSDTEEGGMSVITIAGENKGAFMEVIKSPKKNGFEGTSYHLYKKGNPGGTSNDSSSEFQSYSSSSSEEEGNPNMKKDKRNRAMSMNSTPTVAFMNSNVQDVNNSIVFKSSCTHHDPGVHLALSRKPSNGGFHVKGRSNGYHS